MPFRQPTPIIIRCVHFRGNAYEFPVESVLRSRPGNGQLHIETSSGYGLTTIAHSTPQAQQTLSYVIQPDGSWLAQGRLTLVTNRSSLIDGTVTLRDPIGEILNLMVMIEPALFVDGSTVTFDRTEPNVADFIFLKIRQQGATTPVTLTIHGSNQFTLATSTRESDFAPDLTINTPFEGTYVYIRYAPKRAGRHVARLVITTPYHTKTVSLEGQASNLSNWYRFLEWTGLLTPWRVLNNQSTAPIWKWVLSVLVLGLGYVSYTYRCQLVPGLCQSQNTVKIIIPTRKHAQVKAEVVTAVAEKTTLDTFLTGKTGIDELTLTIHPKNKVISRLVKKVNSRRKSKRKGWPKTFRSRKHKRGLFARMKPTKTGAESDLEKMLNKKPVRKP